PYATLFRSGVVITASAKMAPRVAVASAPHSGRGSSVSRTGRGREAAPITAPNPAATTARSAERAGANENHASLTVLPPLGQRTASTNANAANIATRT